MDNNFLFKFKTDISSIKIPLELNNPFSTAIPEIAKIAAKEFQEFITEEAKTWKYNLFNTIFPMYQFTKWCIKNLGCLIFVKNIDFFIKMNLIAESSLLIDIIRKIKNSD